MQVGSPTDLAMVNAMARDLAATENVLVTIPKDDRALADRLALIMSGCFREGGALWLWKMPNAEDRRAITARMQLLVKSLEHDSDKIGLLVSQMLQGFRARFSEERVDSTKLMRDVRLFQRELALDPPIPTWVVSLVCTSVRLGSHGGKEPSTAELRRLCAQRVWETRAEINVLSEVLKAKAAVHVSAAVRRDIGRKFKELHAEMAERNSDPLPNYGTISVEDLKRVAGPDWDKMPNADRKAAGKALGKEADRLVAAARRSMDKARAGG